MILIQHFDWVLKILTMALFSRNYTGGVGEINFIRIDGARKRLPLEYMYKRNCTQRGASSGGLV